MFNFLVSDAQNERIFATFAFRIRFIGKIANSFSVHTIELSNQKHVRDKRRLPAYIGTAWALAVFGNVALVLLRPNGVLLIPQ